MADPVTNEKDYEVRKGDVFLSLTIGEGQTGTSDVFIGDKKIVRVTGSIGKLLLGKGSDIAGKALVVRSVVNDVNSDTNKMTVTYKLKGGAKGLVFTSKGSVDAEGAVLFFEATVNMTDSE